MSIDTSCSLMECGVEDDRIFESEDYAKAVAKWCPGCGDHSVLSATNRLLAAEQLPPEKTVFVSGIGCSSRFPHYVDTYGFHGAHGRALPVATGVKLHRPDLHVFAVMGDGDCCSIGAGHWIHAIRYNVNMVALLLDNNIYGLTKKQTSPTTPIGFPSNTQPKGSFLPPLDPIEATLGVTNASFVAQTADWAPSHLAATLEAGFKHPGFAFIRILQRCPVWTAAIFQDSVRRPDTTQLMVHPDGICDETSEEIYKDHRAHDPSDLNAARALAAEGGIVRLGLYYCNPSNARYEETRALPHRTAEDKIRVLKEEFDRYAV